MPIEWNLDPSVFASEEAEQARHKALLDAELARLANPPPEPEPTDSQESPPVDSQESLEPELDEELVSLVYEQQAHSDELITTLATTILRTLHKVDPITRACAIGRALLILGEAELVATAHAIEAPHFPQKGSRVSEENGSVGTVVSVQSFEALVVKWDHMSRAVVSPMRHITLIEPGDE